MKKEVNPAALIGIVTVAVIALVMFGYRMIQPASYAPSPGSPTAGQGGSGASTYSPGGPTGGGTPGKPGAR